MYTTTNISAYKYCTTKNLKYSEAESYIQNKYHNKSSYYKNKKRTSHRRTTPYPITPGKEFAKMPRCNWILCRSDKIKESTSDSPEVKSIKCIRVSFALNLEFIQI